MADMPTDYSKLADELRNIDAETAGSWLSWNFDSLIAALRLAAQAQDEITRLEKLVYVPGLWKCAKCKLSLISATMHVNVGKMSANNAPQECPNGCGPMWRVTERDAGNEVCDRLNKATTPAQEWKNDADRLDFVERNPRRIGWAEGYVGAKGQWTWTDNNHFVQPSDNLRAAIDAALAAEEKTNGK